jgi:hypothetical protein
MSEPESIIDIINKHEFGLNYIPNNVDSLINAILILSTVKKNLNYFPEFKQFASEKI